MFNLIQSADESILLLIQESIRTDLLDLPMVFISTLGNAGLIWIILGLGLTIHPKTRKHGILALVSLLVCFLFNNILLKNLVARPRPYTQIQELVMLMPCPADHSFPSGHTCAAFAVAGSLLHTMERRWNFIRFPALVLAVLMAFSRIYVGVHYPTDVLAAVVIGLLGSWLISRYCQGPYDRLAQSLRNR